MLKSEEINHLLIHQNLIIMKRKLFILGVFFFSLCFSSLNAQTVDFAPVSITAYAAANGGDISNPKVTFYSVSNPTVPAYVCDWYGVNIIRAGGTTGVNYAAVPPGTYNIEFTGTSNSSSCSYTKVIFMQNVKLEAGKHCRLDAYVKCNNAESYFSLTR